MSINKSRIDYLDCLKALAMFGVVWIHSGCSPDILTVLLVDFAFFFLSGFFFKRIAFKEFLRKKINTILIPFLVFHFLYYPYNIIWYYWDNRTFVGFDWCSALDIFTKGTIGTLVPLWFLLCLFFVQVAYYFLSYLNRYVILLLSLLVLFFVENIFMYKMPLYIHSTICCLSYFAIGHLFGKKIITWISLNSNKVRSLIFTSIGYFFFWILYITISNENLMLFVKHCRYLSLYIMLFIGFSYLNRNKILKMILFFGTNTLAMLCIHVAIMRPFNRLGYKFFQSHEPWIGFIITLITFFISYFVIKILNKYLPFLVGKRNVI